MYSHLALCIVWHIFREIRHIHLLFTYIHLYCGMFRPCHIQNPGIFETQDIFRTLSKHILAYSERCVTLAYWEPCHIQNFDLFRILAYLEFKEYSKSCLFTYIQAYLGIFNNDSYNNLNFLFFFHFNLAQFSIKFKRHVLWLQWRDFNTGLSLPKKYAIFKNSVIIE